MKKLFILVVLTVVLVASYFAYRNVNNLLPDNNGGNTVIIQPDNNVPSGEEKPVAEGIELDKQFIYF